LLLEEAEEARKAASEANRSKDEFLASMSHELRTPLTSIIGNTEFLTESHLNEEQALLLRSINVSGHSLLSLVNDILDLSKIDAGKFEIDYAPFDLTSLLRNMEHIFSARARESGLELKVVQTHPAKYKLWGDGKRIGQILINLLGNAVKFTSQGKIELTVWQDETLNFSVEDTGIGMSGEVLDRLFQPFEQADSSISRRFGGTGLGLHISWSLAELMDGEIEVSSTEGEGSRFVLKLPYRESTLIADQEGEGEESETRPRFRGEVLVAEDSLELQLLERKMLESFGVTVTMVGNGEQAVERVNQQPFDLVLMDMMMPVIDGVKATQILREQGHTIPVIALTANVMQKHRDLFRQAGAAGFLEKPIDQKQLTLILRQYLEEQIQGHSDEQKQMPVPEGMECVETVGRILVVDDEQSVRKTYEVILSSASLDTLTNVLLEEREPEIQPSRKEFRVTLASQGHEAVEMARDAIRLEAPYQVAIIDMRMPPGMDGLQTAKALREIDPRIFIVIVTAYSDIDPGKIHNEFGYGVLYLNKPFDAAVVQQTARMLVQLWNCKHLPLQSQVERVMESVVQEDDSAHLQTSVDGELIDQELLDIFIGSTKQRKEALSQSLLNHDWEQTRELAHAIKGTASSFGFPAIAELAAQVHTSAEREQFDELTDQVEGLLSALEKFELKFYVE
jgi:CheY-like chemotaxis protein